jgi:hypothetical protein
MSLALCGALASIALAADDDRLGDAWHDERNPIVKIFGGERLDLWSLRPIAQPDVPDAVDPAVDHPIDRFVAGKLARERRTLSPEADRRTLARRLYFDLTGLPPSPEQMAEFVVDERLDAYERLVDRLLASPAYGEHAARLWLDVVRYSDSNGFDWDEFRPTAWRYRDYVIRSFNADKPFDQFVREQLAGDELLAGPPTTDEEQDALIATTFLRLGPHDNAAGLFNEQARSRHELLTDLTETTGSAFLGLTLACCRCHDHKHDPLSQADHYRFRAFFEPVKFADDLPLNLAAEQEAIHAHNAQIEESLAPLRAKREAAKDDEKQRKQLDEQIKQLERQRRKFELGLLATDAEGDVPATHLLHQGDYKSPRDEVSPGFLSALDPNSAKIDPPAHGRTKGRRLALAEWIVSPQNPLTARVYVNRLWQQHFGRGLVATPNDFGLAGARPTHPELLDFLAQELLRSGWSTKLMHRLMVTSRTYRQMSQRVENASDTDNTSLARQNLRRLSAEQMRDALLAVSGLLTPKAGGSPVWPQLPPEVLQANPAFLDDNETKTKGWYPSPPDQQHVRSVFLVQKRTVRVPLMETFDLPENSTSCARRTSSIVPSQAFSLLNSPLAVEASQAFAERVVREAGDDRAAQIRRTFQLALQRDPTDDELLLCRELLDSRGLTELCRVALNLNEFLYID